MHIESTLNYVLINIAKLHCYKTTPRERQWSSTHTWPSLNVQVYTYLTIITRSSVHVVFDNQHSKKWRVTEQNQNRDRESNEVLRSRLADTGRLVPAWIRDKFTRIQENQEVEKTMYETSKARSGNCAASKIHSSVFSSFYVNVKIIEAHASRRRTTARRASRAPPWTRNRCAHVNMSSQSLQSINRQTAIEDFIQWHLRSRQP